MFLFTPLRFPEVKIRDPFWQRRLQVNHERSLPKQYEMCERTGRFAALKLQWKPGQPDRPHPFWDSDTAKWLEAACYACRLRPDENLRAQIDRVVQLFAGAQQPDGYLNSFFTVIDQDRRWKNLRYNHELYCAGHIFEAAVAHYELTGTREFLDVACRLADCIDAVFGLKDGQLPGYCGHPEIELALVRLHHATGEQRYLDLASFFVEQRGKAPLYFERETAGISADMLPMDAPPTYFQAHLPIREQTEAVGHAVRAAYLYCAVADLARDRSDASLLRASEKLWQSVVREKLYVTGGIGSTWHGEAFTGAYDLPNERAYCETCASVSLIFWAHRLLQHSGQATYSQVIERALFNGALAGMSLDGESFFYQNPLASLGGHHRESWFGCSCCPSNLSRLLACLGSYIYSQADDELRVHLYIGSDAAFTLQNGARGSLRQAGNAPWQGNIRFDIDLAEPRVFKLALRIPEWSGDVVLRINGEDVEPVSEDGYLVLERDWEKCSVVEIDFSMEAMRICSHPNIVGNAGQIALQRGPFIYCLEEADLGVSALQVGILRDAPLTAREMEIPPGEKLMMLESQGIVRLTSNGGELYHQRPTEDFQPLQVRAIPYYAWDNRTPGTMRVWIPEA